VLHPAQDPASDLFTALVTAAASAANGRNALAGAPSLPRHPVPASPAHEQPRPGRSPEPGSPQRPGARRPRRLPSRRPQRPGHLRAAHQQPMTAPLAFGDFLTAAPDHASVAAARPKTDRGGDHVQEVTDSLLHVITVMSRYLNDITTVPGDEQPGPRPPMTAWTHRVAV
jgi:hypothetical protein